MAFAKSFMRKEDLEKGTKVGGGITQEAWEAFLVTRGSKRERVGPFEGAV